MFSISLKSDRYPTYVLSDQAAQTRLEVVPERGGLITRWQLQGEDILYFDAERFANPALSVRGGIPILFPICGNLPDNQFVDQGQVYSLKQHGFARDLPWTVTEQNVQGGASLTLVLNSDDRTRAQYPFDFQLAFTYRLQGQTLTLQQRVTNGSDRPMPFSLGLHPYFAVADKSQLEFELPVHQYRDQKTQEQHPYRGGFDWAADELDLAFRPLSGYRATVVDRQRGHRLTLTWDPAYSTLVFWTLSDKPYYCLEPWTAPRNALNTGEDRLLLGARETQTLTVTFVVEPM
jgi:galactose mutarotase-like enzyme